MGTVELIEDCDGHVVCPRRGEIDVQWCLGCPRRIAISYTGLRTVVECEPGPERGDGRAGPLCDVPEPFRTY